MKGSTETINNHNVMRKNHKRRQLGGVKQQIVDLLEYEETKENLR